MKTTKTGRVVMVKRQFSVGDNPDYVITIDGKPFGDLFYNMTGYSGYLPVPPDAGSDRVGNLHTPEGSLAKKQAAFKQVAQRWHEWFTANPGAACYWNGWVNRNTVPQSTIA